VADLSFKDLCFDAERPATVARFWADLLEREVELLDDGDARLLGETPAETIWVNQVPEAQGVKNRVHVDVRLADPSDVRGGTVLREPTEEDRWRVVADPDGLQLCVMGPREGAPFGVFEVVVDAVEPEAIASWWASRFGVEVQRQEGVPWVWLEGVPGFPYGYWVFNVVPEPKTVKNRVHWDVVLVDATVDDLVAAGATLLRPLDDEIRWTVLADPEGNEFCAFAAQTAPD
jgi:hypothetical protein